MPSLVIGGKERTSNFKSLHHTFWPDIYTSEPIETEPPGLVVLYVISSISYICVINAKYMGEEEWVINIIIHCGCK